MNGGVYFILSIYATLCSLYIQCAEDLQHVQSSMATASRIDDFALTMSVFALRRDGAVVDDERLIWDPGIINEPVLSSSSPIDFDVRHESKRRVWDPGIALITTVLTACRVNVNTTPYIDRNPFLPWSMTMAMVSTTDTTDANNNTSLYGHDGVFRKGVCRFPLPLRPTRPMARPLMPAPATTPLFHYSHPVLSRPTVPNNDS